MTITNIINNSLSTSTKDQFIKNLINELNSENENRINHNKKPLDIPYIVSVVDQQIENCKEFIDDITMHTYCINGYDEDCSGGYTNGKIRILIEKPNSEKESEYMVDAYYDYCYYIEFTKDERHWGYCECTSEDKGYNEKYKCCGYGCDWNSPAFRIEKNINLGYCTWEGQERDYWEYKEQFESNEQNINEEVEKFKLEEKKQKIRDRIKELQEEYNKLESEELEKEKYKEFGNLKLVK